MLKVIGAGLGRTGTHSLGFALEMLGIGPCYNINAVAQNPGHTEIWKTASEGKPVDWDFLFQSYGATVEWPSVSFLPLLLDQYPDSKVVLTLREPQAWFDSVNSTVFNALEASVHNPDPEKRARSAINRRLILEDLFSGQHRQKEHTIQVYNQHIQDVVDRVAPGRLLQYQVTEGWEPLCDFLGVPVPEVPFPTLNNRSSFMSATPDWAKTIPAGQDGNTP
jgi:hypothetical protein